MRNDILAMFNVPTANMFADNDTWILDPELYPEDIFGELPERSRRKMKPRSSRPDLELLNSGNKPR